MPGRRHRRRPALPTASAWFAGFVLTQEGRFPEAPRPRVVPGGVRGPRLRVGGGRQRAAGRVRPSRPGRRGGTHRCAAAVRILAPLGDAWGLQHAEAALGRIAQADRRFADAARHHARASVRGRPRLPRRDGPAPPAPGRAQLAADDPAAAATLRQAPAGPSGRATCACLPTPASRGRSPAVGRRPGRGTGAAGRGRPLVCGVGAGDDAALAADLLAGLRSADPATGVHERRSQVP